MTAKPPTPQPWCPACIEWYLKQRRANPDLQLQSHLDRCVCKCHVADGLSTRAPITTPVQRVSADWLRVSTR